MKKLFVFLLVCPLTMANLSAQAVDKVISPGTSFTINSTAAATAGSTYQWLENGIVISGATAANYTIPSTKPGGVYTYVRQSKSGSCSDWQDSNAYTVFVGTNDPGVSLVVNGVTWSSRNVDAPNTFASMADLYTLFYQFNRKVGYHATSPGNNLAYGSGWTIASIVENSDWRTANNPCPSGWRVPSEEEWRALNNVGTTWVNAGVRGAAVAGRFFGPNHASCSLPSSMTGCIFLPAVGYRQSSNGSLYSPGFYGYYWSSRQYDQTTSYFLYFNNGGASLNNSTTKAYGYSVRCVK